MSASNKVCHLTSVHRDGDVRIFHKECTSLAEAGFEVYLIVPNTSSRMEKGVNIVSFESKPKSRLSRMHHTVNRVLNEALKVDAEIYHIHDPELLRIVGPLKRKGKKVIYDAHEDLPRQILAKHWIPLPLRKVIANLSENVENRWASKCDAIVTATPFIEERFNQVNSTTVAVNNFPILKELSLDTKRDASSVGTVCYVGGITQTRGIIELLESLKYTKARLLLAGEFLEENLKETAIQIEGWQKTEELGFLDREGVKGVYQRSQIGIVTLHPISNYLDSLPVKMFEYMLAGLPVIASNFKLWKSIIEEHECGICVDPLNPRAIGEAIDYLIDHPELATKMGENGKALALEKYNWGFEEQKLLSIYEQLRKK